MGGASGPSLTALSGPHDTPSSGPIEGPIKAPGGCMLRPTRATASKSSGGPLPFPQHQAPALATPLGPLVIAYEARCRTVAIGHCACPWPWLCCLGLPCSRPRAHSQHASPARTPRALGWCPWPSAGAHGLWPGPMPGPRPGPCTWATTRPPGEALALSPCSCGGPRPAFKKGPGWHRPLNWSSRASIPGDLGLQARGPCSDPIVTAQLQLQPRRGAIELNLFSVPIALLHVRLSRLTLHFIILNLFSRSRVSLLSSQ